MLAKRDDLGGEKHPQRTFAPNQPRQPLGAAERGCESEIDLRLAEFRAIARDCERSRLGYFAAAAVRETVDRNDDRLGEGLDTGSQTLAAPDELAQRRRLTASNACGKTRNVRSCRKRAVSGPCQNDRPNLVVLLEFIEDTHQPINQVVVERIQLVRPIQREQRHRSERFAQDDVGHGVGSREGSAV